MIKFEKVKFNHDPDKKIFIIKNDINVEQYNLTQDEKSIKDKDKILWSELIFNSKNKTNIKKEIECIKIFHGEDMVNEFYILKKNDIFEKLKKLNEILNDYYFYKDFSSYGAKFFLEENFNIEKHLPRKHALYFDYLEDMFEDIVVITKYCYKQIYEPIITFVDNGNHKENYSSFDDFFRKNSGEINMQYIQTNISYDSIEKQIQYPTKHINITLHKNIKNESAPELLYAIEEKKKITYLFVINENKIYFDLIKNDKGEAICFSENFIYWIKKLFELNENFSFYCIISGQVRSKKIINIIEEAIINERLVVNSTIFSIIKSGYENFIFLSLLNIYYSDQLLLDDLI